MHLWSSHIGRYRLLTTRLTHRLLNYTAQLLLGQAQIIILRRLLGAILLYHGTLLLFNARHLVKITFLGRTLYLLVQLLNTTFVLAAQLIDFLIVQLTLRHQGTLQRTIVVSIRINRLTDIKSNTRLIHHIRFHLLRPFDSGQILATFVAQHRIDATIQRHIARQRNLKPQTTHHKTARLIAHLFQMIYIFIIGLNISTTQRQIRIDTARLAQARNQVTPVHLHFVVKLQRQLVGIFCGFIIKTSDTYERRKVEPHSTTQEILLLKQRIILQLDIHHTGLHHKLHTRKAVRKQLLVSVVYLILARLVASQIKIQRSHGRPVAQTLALIITNRKIGTQVVTLIVYIKEGVLRLQRQRHTV